jgi:uncharacterized protein (DUF488 family)
MRAFTAGYGGRKPDDFARLLKDASVRVVVDVRLRPDKASMGAYVKAQSPEKGLERLLSAAGIAYVSLVELGNVFMGLEGWPPLYARLLQGSGALLTERLRALPEGFCLLCAEKRAEGCHRKQIADWLAAHHGYAFTHLE